LFPILPHYFSLGVLAEIMNAVCYLECHIPYVGGGRLEKDCASSTSLASYPTTALAFFHVG
jgi:hypothetical protein